jgi:hypothetical protein
MVRIAISVEAFAAICATLPLGSVGYENKTNERSGERSRSSALWISIRRMAWGAFSARV